MSDILTTNWISFTASVWGAIAFVVIGTTFFAYLLNTYGLKELSPSVVSMYIYFQPFLATLFAILMGKDEITPIKILSALFIISGVYIVNKKIKT
jgi:drug/metabolite transporter (DMT)-like permease